MTEDPPPPATPAAATEGAAQPTAPPPGAAPIGEASPTQPRKVLTRSREHRVIAGVCGGIATYLDVDPVLVRVAFAMLALFTQGFGLVAYIVLWVVMPEDGAEPIRAAGGRGASSGGGGAVVIGVLLIAAGAVWLLEAVADIQVDWGTVTAGALVVVGVLIMVTGGGARGGLITLGVLMTLVLMMSGPGGMHGPDMRFRGGLPGSGFGDRTERPRAASALRPSYSHAFGSMTLDMRGVELPPGTTRVSASTVFGSAQVFLPDDVPVRVVASTSFGSIDLLGEEVGGFGERTLQTDDYDAAQRRIELTVSTVFGSAEVQR